MLILLLALYPFCKFIDSSLFKQQIWILLKMVLLVLQ